MQDNKQLVAVYGTLRKGQGNHRRLAHEEVLSTETISGFGMVSLGGFPAIYTTNNEEDTIVIEVYSVDDLTMKSLDALEGYPNFYDRKKVQTSQGEAWIYFIDSYRNSTRTKIESGDWIEYVEHRESKMFI